MPARWSAVRTCPVAGSNTVETGPAPTGTDWVWVYPPCPSGRYTRSDDVVGSAWKTSPECGS